MSAAQQRTSVQCELVAEVARAFGEVRLKVRGSSMLPAIWPGEILLVRRQDLSALRVGQVVLYSRCGAMVAHRIVQRAGERLWTKGDSLLYVDLPVCASDIIGQVMSIVRNGEQIDPQQSGWQRAAARLLSRSDFFMRLVLGIAC